MTITEAQEFNTLLLWMLGMSRPGSRVPTDDEALAAATYLTGRAFKALTGGGLSTERLMKAWPHHRVVRRSSASRAESSDRDNRARPVLAVDASASAGAITVYGAGNDAPPRSTNVALLDHTGRWFTRPAFENAEGLWCHASTGRIPWSALPFPVVAVPVPDYQSTVDAHLGRTAAEEAP